MILPIRAATALQFFAKFFRILGDFTLGFTEFLPNSEEKIPSRSSDSRPDAPGLIHTLTPRAPSLVLPFGVVLAAAGVTGHPPPAALVLVCTPVFGTLGIALSPPPRALALGVGVSPVLSLVLTPRAPSLVHTLSPRAPFLVHVLSLCALGLVRAPVPCVLHLVRALTPCAPGLVGTMTPCAPSLVHPSDDVLASCSKPPALAI